MRTLRYNINNYYLCYLHCLTYTTYHVRLQTDTYHIICKKERLTQKILTITKDKKATIVSGRDKSKSLTRNPKVQRLTSLIFRGLRSG